MTGMPSVAMARDLFNPAFLNDITASGKRVDLSAYEQANAQAPGTYKVDVFINSEFIETADVVFTTSKQKNNELFPSFNIEKLNS